MPRKPRMKQAFTTAPKKGKVKSAGHDMGGTFNKLNPKRLEPDMKPRTRGQERADRMKRLGNKFI